MMNPNLKNFPVIDQLGVAAITPKNLLEHLPESIHRHIKEFAKNEGVSINLFIVTAIAEKISPLATEDYLLARASRAKAQDFADTLAKVEDRPPRVGDEF